MASTTEGLNKGSKSGVRRVRVGVWVELHSLKVGLGFRSYGFRVYLVITVIGLRFLRPRVDLGAWGHGLRTCRVSGFRVGVLDVFAMFRVYTYFTAMDLGMRCCCRIARSSSSARRQEGTASELCVHG